MIHAALERQAPLAKAGGWDPVGLQIGDATSEAGNIAVCHEVTEPVVERAIELDVDLLVSYHPLLFRPTTQFVAGSGPAGRAWRLARAGVSLLVVHTAFDVAAAGAADALAAAVGLMDVAPFGPLWPGNSSKIVVFVPAGATDDVIDAMTAAGAGVIGNYSRCAFTAPGSGTFVPGDGAAPAIGSPGQREVVDEVRVEMVVPDSSVDTVVAALVAAHPYEEPAFDVVQRRGDVGFLGRVGTFPHGFDHLLGVVHDELGASVRSSGNPDGETLRVAVVPGSGGSLVGQAAGAGARVLVTGDVKHHDARRAAELGLAVIDPGHAATERPGVARLYAALADEVGAIVDLTDIDPDPWA
jgi:dinuclear metal center YbgI/SA1388 family protein